MNKQERQAGCPMRKTSIGGQALIEGIMMRGPKQTAMAVRDPQGEIVLEKWETKSTVRGKFFRLPFIRGIFNFVDSMVFGYKCLMRSAEIAGLEEVADPEQEGKKDTISPAMMNVIMVVSSVLGVVLAVTLFKLLPEAIYELIARFIPVINGEGYGFSLLRAFFIGVMKVFILVGYMKVVTLMKDIRRTFMYHGAEHKTIFCYEHGLELTVENVRGERRFHPRCGTSFLILMVLVNIVISMFIPAQLSDVRIVNILLRTLISLVIMPLIVGIGYELIKLAGKHDNWLTRAISAPGLWLQRITVLEPDDSMIECAIAAVKEVIPDDGSDRW